MTPHLSSIADILRTHASERPGMTALLCETRETTFGMLDQRASQVAHGLIQGLQHPQDRAGVLETNSPTFFELLFGAAKANRVLVPINTRLLAAEMVEIINDANVSMLFLGSEFLDVAETLRRNCPGVSQIVSLEGPRAGCEDYAAWRDCQVAWDPQIAVQRSDVILLVYTSGTTGRPRGAQLTHENLLTNAPLLVEEYGSVPGKDVGLVCMPLFHVSGSLWGLSCLYAGARIVILRRIAAADILSAIAEHRVTKALLVPTVIQLLLDDAARHVYDLSSLDLILYGASPISEAVLRRALSTFECHFGQVYGLTETAGAITYLPPEGHDLANPARLQSCGKPLPHAQIRVVDKDGRDAPVGEIGEIVCRSTQNMKGYWNNPDESAAVLRGQWLHTGDLGYFDVDGYLYIQDRIKDLIISGGENVYPAEVERVLSTHAGVADVAVIGVPDNRWGEAAKALVVRRRDFDVTANDLMDFCRARIAAYKVPKSFDFVDALRRNAAGKLLKHELRAPYWDGRARAVN